MKILKVYTAAAMLAVSVSASAQFINGGASSNSSPATKAKVWSTIWVEYNPGTFKYDLKAVSDQSFTGLSFGYSCALNVVPSLPLFVEAGLGPQYSFYSDVDNDANTETEVEFSMFSLKLPVNLLYKFDLPNTSIALMPYVGLNLRYNLSAEKETTEYRYEKKSYSHDTSLFDKKKMGDDVWNRFQVGWQIGIKTRFGKNVQFGLSYGSDFSEIAPKTKIGTTTISLSWVFLSM